MPYLANSGFEVIAASRTPAMAYQQRNVSTARLPASVDEWSALLSGVDAVIHLAGLAHRAASAEEHNQINHLLAAEIAEAASRCGVGHFVFVSSIAAQSGPTAAHVLTEHDEPHPGGPYGVAKLAAERAVAKSGVPFTILRPVVIDGPGAKGNAATLNLLARIPVPLPFGGLENRRSTLSVGNFSSAVGTVLFNPKAMGETFIVADPDAMTVADIIAKVRHQRGGRASLFNVNPNLLKLALRMTGRSALWERLGCPLIADPAKLMSIGWAPDDRRF